MVSPLSGAVSPPVDLKMLDLQYCGFISEGGLNPPPVLMLTRLESVHLLA